MTSSSSSATTEMHLSSPLSSDSSLSSLSNSPSPKEEEESNEFYHQPDPQLDPFTYLLQPDVMAADDLTQPSLVNDWSSFPSFVDNGVQSKAEAMDFGGEFNFAMSVDLGLEPTFIDPSALHFNTSIFTQPDPSAHAYDPNRTEFIPPPLLCQNGPHPGRRLSVTSSSSSSGASLSPILDKQPTAEIPATVPANSHEELARKILQAIGATLTVPSDTSNLVSGMFIYSLGYRLLHGLHKQVNPSFLSLVWANRLLKRRFSTNLPSSPNIVLDPLPHPQAP